MKGLTAKDREVLGLYAARMSTASIASMCGGSEAAIYNRLTRLGVTSVGQALELLRSDDASRKAAAQRYAPPLPKAAIDDLSEQIRQVSVETLVEGQSFLKPTDQGGSFAPGTVQAAFALAAQSAVPAPPSPAPAASPAAASPPAYRSGGLRLKPVSDRIARWAGHFLRAGWPLQEVADLFDVAEDDLAQACGAAA